MSPRLDQALVAAGLAPSRARAQALIAAGVVRLDGAPAARPAARVPQGARLELTGDPLPYVSRGALKLRHALAVFGLDPAGAVALDLGASTGGFTQVLLEAGAAEVWAVDVGHGQLAPAVRADPRVRAIEGLNARDLSAAHVPPPDWIVADLSFISLRQGAAAGAGAGAPGGGAGGADQAAVRGRAGAGRQGRDRARPGRRSNGRGPACARSWRARDGRSSARRRARSSAATATPSS